MTITLQPTIKNNDYWLLCRFYQRNLGGESYFTWKHIEDIYDNKINPIKKVFHYKEDGKVLGIIISTQYNYLHNEKKLTVNVIGDLGVANEAESMLAVKKLLISSHCQNVDASICFSDDRKIKIYDTIFKRHIKTKNQIIPFNEVIIKTLPTKKNFTLTSLSKIEFNLFNNYLGRVKDHLYVMYLKKHPGYQDIFVIERGHLIVILGLTDEYVEILDISGTTSEHFRWAISASYHFHSNCKVLLPHLRAPSIYNEAGEIIENKKQNMMISWYSTPSVLFDDNHTWVCRVDRR